MVLEDGAMWLGHFPMKQEPESFSVFEYPEKFHVLTAFGHGYCEKDMAVAQTLAAHIFNQWSEGNGTGPHYLQ